MGRTAVQGRDQLAGWGFRGGKFRLLRVRLAFEVALLTNDLRSSLPRLGWLSNDLLGGVDAADRSR